MTDKQNGKNLTPLSLLGNTLGAALGLILFGLGTYVTIRANMGVAPWDALNTGLSKTFGLSFGTCSIAVSLVILAADILLREKIGVGMFLDAFLVGITVDACNALSLIPQAPSLLWGTVYLLSGMTVMGFSQFLYMRAGLGCGPRDTFLVGLSRKLPRLPIGLISIIIMAVVTLQAYLLGGDIGIGTLVCAFLVGPIMQFAFFLVRFRPTEVLHQDVLTSCKVLFGIAR
ncbi:MAG: hypothetical protein MJ078_04955 [Clostridia bacterium]|nr:hypothetical protein [Clostridia bacterium]